MYMVDRRGVMEMLHKQIVNLKLRYEEKNSQINKYR